MEFMIPIVLFMCVTTVLIVRPITKKLGGLIEAMTLQRTSGQRSIDEQQNTLRMAMLLEQIAARLDSVEERLDFTERLVATPAPQTRRQFQRRAPSLETEIDELLLKQ